MYKSLTLCFALVVCSLMASSSFAQTADPLTGRLSMSLPIWTVNSGSVSAPVGIFYSGGNGIKVNDSESSAGMGWTVNAGGSVSREVRGLPDDYVGTLVSSTDNRYGWLHQNVSRQAGSFIPSADLNYSTCTDEVTDYNALSAFANTDTEPDVFNFSAPGLSGQFMFDNNKVIRTIPYQDLKIDITRGSTDSLISQIIITNNAGVQYTFQGGDKTSRLLSANSPLGKSFSLKFFGRLNNLYGSTSCTYYSSWHLTQITSPAGGAVTFAYGSDVTSISTNYLQVVDSVVSRIDTLYSDSYTTTTQRLLAITGSNEKATLSWNGNLLIMVSVNDLTYQTLTKKFNLQYQTVYGSKRVIQSSRRVKRSFLSGLVEELNCNAYPGYGFKYYGVDFKADTTEIPFNSPIRQDIFGYYNNTSTSLIPEIYTLSPDTGTDGERYRIAPATGYVLTSGGGRSINPSKVYYGMLQTVTLPSGGKTTITYEPSDYYDITTLQTSPGAGVRVKTIKTSANDPTSDVTTTYKYCTTSSPALSSGQWVYRPMFMIFENNGKGTRVPYNVAPDESIYYSRVEESTTGRGKTVYEFQNSGMYGVTSVNDYNATLSRIARASSGTCIVLQDMKGGYYTHPYAPNTNYEFERGLPTHITDYRRDGKLVQRKNYTYQRTSLPVVQISGLRLETMKKMFQYGKYTLLASVGKMTLTEAARVYDQAYTDTTTQFIETKTTYTYSINQMLSQVAATNSDNSTLYTRFKYAKDYTGTSTMIKRLMRHNRQGTLIETTSLNGANVTGSSLTLYDSIKVPYTTWVIAPSQQLVLADPTGFVASYESGSNFTPSTNYYTTAFIDEYDRLGHPTIVRDQSRHASSSIIGYNNSASALDISNARYDQVAFIDFEPGNTFGLTGTTASQVSTDSWSGQYSAAMTSTTNVFQNSVTRAPGKNYRFSCWAKASAPTTLSIWINNGSTAAATVLYPDTVTTATGTWQYLEGIINMDATGVSVNSSFAFKLTSSGTISLDNVAFYPESATIVAHAYDPLNGKTADLDSRGVSGFKEYDAVGRVRYLRNMDKDIVMIKDYHYKLSNGVLPVSTFTGPANPSTGVATTYTANPSCGSGITYAWYDQNGTLLSSASSLTYTFTQNKTYYLTLVATGTSGSSSSTMTIDPTASFNASMTVSGPTPIGAQYCVDQPTYTLSISFGPGVSYDPGTLTYVWTSTDSQFSMHVPDPSVSSITIGTTTIAQTYTCGLAARSTNATTGAVQQLFFAVSSPQFSCRISGGGQ